MAYVIRAWPVLANRWLANGDCKNDYPHRPSQPTLDLSRLSSITSAPNYSLTSTFPTDSVHLYSPPQHQGRHLSTLFCISRRLINITHFPLLEKDPFQQSESSQTSPVIMSARFGMRFAQQTTRQAFSRTPFQVRNPVFRRWQGTAANPAVEGAPRQTLLQKLWTSEVGIRTVHFWYGSLKHSKKLTSLLYHRSRLGMDGIEFPAKNYTLTRS